MPRTLGLLGVPSSAGAKTPGIDKAVAALRAAGLVERLTAAGADVVDHGDLPRTRWTPDPAHPRGQNPDGVAAVAAALRDRLAPVLAAGHVPVVLGGDCTVTVGAVAAWVAADRPVTLLYVDGGVDLYTPATNDEGNLDSMGVAHLLGEDGATALARIGPRHPLLTPDRVVFFGFDPAFTEPAELDVLERHGMARVTADAVHGRARAAAAEALALVDGPFLVHLDVDVIDFLDLPIADVPSVGFGLTFADTLDAVEVFCADPRFAGLVVTEVNPDHTDEAGDTLRTFTARLATALTVENDVVGSTSP